jgi:hypothetical protein
MILKRNKEILAEKDKLHNLMYEVDALQSEVDPTYINPRVEELKKLAAERGKYERQRKEYEKLRTMQDDVDSSMLSASLARFDIPTNQETQEFESKIDQ